MGKIILEIEDDKIKINEVGGMGKPFIMRRDNLREKVEELEGVIEFQAVTIRELHSEAFPLSHTVSQEKIKVLEEAHDGLLQRFDSTDKDLRTCRELNKELKQKMEEARVYVRRQDAKLEHAVLHYRHQIKLIEDNRDLRTLNEDLQKKIEEANACVAAVMGRFDTISDQNRAYSKTVVPALHKEIRELKNVIKLHAAAKVQMCGKCFIADNRDSLQKEVKELKAELYEWHSTQGDLKDLGQYE